MQSGNTSTNEITKRLWCNEINQSKLRQSLIVSVSGNYLKYKIFVEVI